ncbi:hypothetical protein AM218_12470 [Hymenobacter sp. DG25A]|nr:hypothetical protein AM218_12470 [Hymenobacter sp. DG25A]
MLPIGANKSNDSVEYEKSAQNPAGSRRESEDRNGAQEQVQPQAHIYHCHYQYEILAEVAVATRA